MLTASLQNDFLCRNSSIIFWQCAVGGNPLAITFKSLVCLSSYECYCKLNSSRQMVVLFNACLSSVLILTWSLFSVVTLNDTPFFDKVVYNVSWSFTLLTNIGGGFGSFLSLYLICCGVLLFICRSGEKLIFVFLSFILVAVIHSTSLGNSSSSVSYRIEAVGWLWLLILFVFMFYCIDNFCCSAVICCCMFLSVASRCSPLLFLKPMHCTELVHSGFLPDFRGIILDCVAPIVLRPASPVADSPHCNFF
jgi:hypothetical protein